MTVKQWLSRARICDREIKVLQTAVDRERDRVTSLTASLDGAAVSGSPDPHKFDKYAELSADLMARIRELYDLKAEVEAGVMRLPAGTLREILLLRYVSVMTWEQIAVTMDLSYRHVCRLHGDALEEIKKILPMS